MIGRYEGRYLLRVTRAPHTPPSNLLLLFSIQCLSRFFNTAMDQLRKEFNKEDQRVVFVATSDDFHWIKKHLVDKQAFDHFLSFLDLSFFQLKKHMPYQAWYRSDENSRTFSSLMSFSFSFSF